MVTKLCATFILEGAREGQTAKQVIRMDKEAYDNMTSIDCPKGEKTREWKRLSKEQKIKKQLNKIKFDLDAKEFSFEIFPD